jgi:hypothetical protein
MMRNRFPKPVVVQGRKPYVCSHDSSEDRIKPRGRRMIEAVESPLPSTPSEISRERRRACEVPPKARISVKTTRVDRREAERRLVRAIDEVRRFVGQRNEISQAKVEGEITNIYLILGEEG